ncbi:Ig-like domain-containing protein, partial [Rickettsiales bacterium]|nr:Ig-like domain-containing protein [Rickettsiales bacterium]
MAESNNVAFRLYNPLYNDDGSNYIIDHFGEEFVNSVIDLTNITNCTSFSDLQISSSGSDTIIGLEDGKHIKIKNILPGEINSNNFITSTSDGKVKTLDDANELAEWVSIASSVVTHGVNRGVIEALGNIGKNELASRSAPASFIDIGFDTTSQSTEYPEFQGYYEYYNKINDSIGSVAVAGTALSFIYDEVKVIQNAAEASAIHPIVGLTILGIGSGDNVANIDNTYVSMKNFVASSAIDSKDGFKLLKASDDGLVELYADVQNGQIKLREIRKPTPASDEREEHIAKLKSYNEELDHLISKDTIISMFDPVSGSDYAVVVTPSSILVDIANDLGMSEDDLIDIAENNYWVNRKLIGADGGHMYLSTFEDSLNITPEDNDFGYVAYNFADKENTSVEITQKAAGVGNAQTAIENIPTPNLKPKNIEYTDADGTTTNYFSTGDKTVSELFRDAFGNPEAFDTSGIEQIATSFGTRYVNADQDVSILDEVVGNINININKLNQMVQSREASVDKFFNEIIGDKLSGVLGENAFNGASADLVENVVKGLIDGRELDDIMEGYAARLVAEKGLEKIFEELDFLPEKPTGGQQFAMEATQAALTQVVVTAIIRGRDAGLEDYAKAAAIGSVQYAISKASEQLYAKMGSAGSPAVVNGAATAVFLLTSSLISNGEITQRDVRTAAVAAATTAAAIGIQSALVLANPYGIAIMAISTVISFALDKLFGGGPAEKIFHNETRSHVVQEKEDGTGDIIIGVREAGALLQAGSGSDDIIGTIGHDVLVGNDNKNTLFAKEGDDMLEGRGEADALLAGSGDDHVEAGSGDDYIEGNEGHDKIYGDSGDDIILAGSGDDIVSGGDGNDKIEGEDGDDILSGDSGNDVILGGSGNDNIDGGAGNDFLDGGNGDDVIDGNIGDDEIYGGSGNDLLFGDQGNDTLRGGQGRDIIYGDDGTDLLYGDLGDDILDGGEGADLLAGGIGNDVLFGQDGNDHIYGEIGNDYLVGGKGKDRLDGGDGDDVYIFGRGDGYDIVSDSAGSDIIRFANYTVEETKFIKNGNDLLLSSPDGSDQILIENQLKDSEAAIERVVFSDGRYVDLSSLNFDDAGAATYEISDYDLALDITEKQYFKTWQEVEEDRSYQAYSASSSWYGNNFDISVNGGADAELYNDVQVRVNTWKKRTWHGRTRHYHEYYDYFEKNLVGGELSDRIIGLWWDENIEGRGGDDQLYGNGGADTISGGDDHDLIFGGSREDIITSDEGNDKAYGGTGNDNIQGNAGNDTIYGEWGDDTLSGGDGDDMVSGGFGNDNIQGNAGNDLLFGNVGNDIIDGGSGDDFIIGGDGNDTINGGSGADYIEGGKGSDNLRGGDGNDIIRGEEDGDQLYGDNDNDLLIGGQGADYIDGGAGEDTVSYAESDDGVTVNLATGSASGGYAAGDTVINVEHIRGSDFDDHLTGTSGDNTLVGGYGNDQLFGGDGDDLLKGGAGADYLDGGAGYDKVSYDLSSSGVEIDLQAGTGKYGYAQGDRFVNMEHIIGSKYDDKIIVGNSNLTFEGGGGKDTAVFAGASSLYDIVLDRDIITVTRKSDNVKYTLPSFEYVQFENATFSIDDFPGRDSIASIIKDNSANGVINTRENITVEAGGAASNGNVVINNDGTYTYTPNSGYLGGDNFSFRITDTVNGLVSLQNVDVRTNEDNGVHHINEFIVKDFRDDSGTILEGEQRNVISAVLDNGNVVLAWNGYGNYSHTSYFQAKIIDANGKIIVDDFKVSSDTGGYWDRHAHPDIAVLNNGDFVVTWKRTSGSSTTEQFASIYTSSGEELAKEISLANSPHSTNYFITPTKDGGFVSLYEGQSSTDPHRGSISMQKYDSGGNSISTIEVNNSGQPKDVDTLDNGNIVIVWKEAAENSSEGYNIYTGIWKTDGTPLVQKIKINEITHPWLEYATVSALDNGNFVVSWSRQYISSGDKYEVFARLYDKNGNALTSEFQVNTTTQNYQYKSSISPYENGKFVITWEGETPNEPSIGDVNTYAQLFDSDGTKIGVEFLVNDPLYARKTQQDIKYLGNDKFIASWVTQSSEDIYSKVFSVGDLTGTTGNDVLQGGDGDDSLIGLSGADTLDGGAGIDTASYADSDAAINIDLSAAPQYDAEGNPYIEGSGGHADGDRLRNIENITGSKFDDNITGDAGANLLDGGEGDDTLNGAGGADKLIGGAGSDNLSGGEGDDIIKGGDGDDT